MELQNVTIKLEEEKLEPFVDYYKAYQVENNGLYVVFCAKLNGLVITVFSSKKGHKVFFSGNNALKEAQKWEPLATENAKKEKAQTKWLCLDDQIGSDEVGVGDFLLPMIVVAAYVKKTDLDYIKKLGVDDSKKINDDLILEIVPKLIKKIKVSKLTISNLKYNEMIQKGENINSLKAKMHNQALKNLKQSFKNVTNIFIDQFVNEKTYYEYLSSDDILDGIVFKTKGESYYPSIACASVVARYCFLKEKEKLENKYLMKFPLGANKKTNEFAINFLKKYGQKEFEKIAKKNFANYREVLELL